jgi:hypothetical protein
LGRSETDFFTNAKFGSQLEEKTKEIGHLCVLKVSGLRTMNSKIQNIEVYRLNMKSPIVFLCRLIRIQYISPLSYHVKYVSLPMLSLNLSALGVVGRASLRDTAKKL